MSKKMECCGNCRLHRKDQETGEWVCINPESEYYGLETEYEFVCSDHENK